MKRCRFLTILLVAMMTSGAVAQSAGTDAGASRDDILRLFEVLQVRSQMKLVMEQVTQQIKSVSHEEAKRRDPNVTDEEMAKMDAMSEQVVKNMPIDGMLDDMIPVYQKHLSRSDVDTMISFYSTPTGQKILHEMPAIASEGMQAVQPRLRKQMEEAREKVDQMEKDELEKEQHPANAPATPKS